MLQAGSLVDAKSLTQVHPNLTFRASQSSQKLRNKKYIKKNYFSVFNSTMKNTKKNKIYLKLVINSYIFKLFNFYIDEINLK